MKGAEAGFAAGVDLSGGAHKAAHEFGVFVVNHVAVDGAKVTLFLFLLRLLRAHKLKRNIFYVYFLFVSGKFYNGGGIFNGGLLFGLLAGGLLIIPSFLLSLSTASGV